GEPMLGLAIAWHCMRSGRKEEAGEQLIRGGNEAIARSALVEAETALRSGVKTVPKKYQGDVEDLLLYVLVDQGRYTEARQMIPEEVLSGTPITTMRSGLLTIARAGASSPHSINGQLHELRSFISGNPPPALALRALVAAAHLIDSVGTPEHHDWLLASIDALPGDGEWHSSILLLKAQALYHARALTQAEALLNRLAEDDSKSTRPLVHEGRISLGLGVCLTARGMYAEADGHFARAQAIAAKAGAMTLERNAVSNRVLCHFRLGRYEQARKLASGTFPSDGSQSFIRHWLAILGIRACVEAEMQLTDELSRTIVAGDNLTAGMPASPTCDMWQLMVADALFRSGSVKEALRRAQSTLRQSGPPPLQIAGRMARWSGILLANQPSELLNGILASATELLPTVDCIDRLEIATAALTTTVGPADNRTSYLQVVEEAARQLPRETVTYLERFRVSPAGTSSPAKATSRHASSR
ncbi:MAG TPA: hypothetical protein VG963_32450, partial [Polyangiaceae bacterium]|nr:hypothetical protein [Polyangiaceae bacterium]